MKTKKPSSVMSDKLKVLMADSENAEIIQNLILIIASAPDCYAREQRTIAIQAFAELLLKKDSKRN